MAKDDQNPLNCCFNEWLKLEEQDHKELLQALTPCSNHANNVEARLPQLIEENIRHFQDYMEKRSQLARGKASSFFAANWCNSLESSLFWIAGCRPSMFIRLIYSLIGAEVEENLSNFIQGTRTGNLSELSGRQLASVNSLQMEIIREETKLSNQLASLQEDAAEFPFAAAKMKESSCIREGYEDIERVLEKHDQAMATVLKKADTLRLNTIKDLIHILTPKQGVEFLAASKRLHLGIHEWGQIRDCQHRRI